MTLHLSDNLRYVKGIGEARSKLYARLGLVTVEDLLYHLPRSYLDLRAALDPELAPLGELCPVLATVAHKGSEQRIRKGLSLFKVQAVGQTMRLDITFYNAKFTVAALREGADYIFYGRVNGGLFRREMQSPQVFSPSAAGLVPVYPTTAGLTSRTIATHVANCFALLESLPEPLPPELVARYQLLAPEPALRQLHCPTDPTLQQAAHRRLVFEELLTLALGLCALHSDREALRVTPMTPQDLSPFYQSLPFTPTGGQLAAIEDCVADLCSGRPMNRLIQGDVGSGKTLVAAACCFFAHLCGYSTAMMAPTELLAEQHYRTLTALLGPLGVRVGLLTSSLPAKEKRLCKAALAAGELDLCVGTHALLTGDVLWERLGLVITDEQHRFGVAQRMSLTQKGQEVHTLVMSATPIPRTLGLIIYGDLELSVIRELPRGRQPIESYLIDSSKRERAFGYLKKYLDRGLQGYIVCPLVEENADDPQLGQRSAVEWVDELAHGSFAGYRLGLLHGKMKSKDKDAVMKQFAAGKLDLLVATTVIEVGIDVPNAAVIMIENAERFGLSQLHQLRGRVGRGTEKSTCILLSDSQSPETLDRLKTLCKNHDGFAIAEYDLATRGPGDFFGLRQHGLPALRVASLSQDSALLEETRACAQQLLAHDPELQQFPLLAERVQRMMSAAAVL
ncbi:MAG: ATP-dependent DNA helicase RecG [Angelakisella sp.]